MKTIINFVKLHSTEFVLPLITLVLIAGLYLVCMTFTTDWVCVPALIAAPVILLVAFIYAIPDDPDWLDDTTLFVWGGCMLAVLGMQCYLAYPSWGVVWYIVLDAVIGYIGAVLLGLASLSGYDPYE